MKTDSQIQADVIQEIKWDKSVTHENVGVTVTDGVVSLTGTVPGFVEKSAAERAAQRVAGVRAVVEKISVKLPGVHQRNDEDIAKAIIQQFKWNFQVPKENIKTKVENGWVELSGEVEWDFQRIAAENCARGLTGVIGITNNIALKNKQIQPEIIKKRIEEALKREAEREAKHIAVEVSGNKVILSGNVHSFSEIDDIKWAAWSTPGVKSVENKLHVID